MSFPQSLRAHECSAGSSQRLQQGRDFSDIAQSYVYILGQLLVETVHIEQYIYLELILWNPHVNITGLM